MKRRLALALLVALAALAPAVGGASTVSEPGSEGEATIAFVYEVERAPERPGEVVVTLRPRIPEAVGELRLRLGEHQQVIERSGFAPADEENEWRWTGAAAPSLRYVAGTNRASRYAGFESVDAANWTFTSHERAAAGVHFRYWYRGERVTHVERIVPAGEGFAGANYAFLGEHAVETRETGNETLRLIRPNETRFDRSTAALDALEDASARLRVGAREDAVNVFVVPDPMGYGGRTSRYERDGEQDVWVNERMPTSAVNNVWVHEYVHTRQAYDPGAEMEWFHEASAEYYAALFALERGDVDIERFRSHLTSRDDESVLANESTWARTAEYRVGARVLAALDAEIRAATDGERTLQDVFREMNAHPESVTFDAFADIVADVVGHRMDAWLETHVGTTVRPPVPDGTRFVADRGTDAADGDDRRTERASPEVETAASDAEPAEVSATETAAESEAAGMGRTANGTTERGDATPEASAVRSARELLDAVGTRVALVADRLLRTAARLAALGDEPSRWVPTLG